MGLVATLPVLPKHLDRLALYLLNRDVGAPTAVPVPSAISTAPLVGQSCQAFEMDTLTWTYAQPVGLNARRADGFILSWENEDSPAPAAGRVKLSLAARSHQVWWPAGATRSYSIAAFRNTWQGEEVGPAQQLDAWKAVATTPLHVLPVVPVIQTATGLSGASHTFANMIPAGSYPFACFVTNLTAVTGASSYQVGTTLNLDWWGAAVPVGAGLGNATTAFTAQPIGVLFQSAADVVLTANVANFTGGNVEARLLYFDPALC